MNKHNYQLVIAFLLAALALESSAATFIKLEGIYSSGVPSLYVRQKK